jgi:hypothetical protein
MPWTSPSSPSRPWTRCFISSFFPPSSIQDSFRGIETRSIMSSRTWDPKWITRRVSEHWSTFVIAWCFFFCRRQFEDRSDRRSGHVWKTKGKKLIWKRGWRKWEHDRRDFTSEERKNKKKRERKRERERKLPKITTYDWGFRRKLAEKQTGLDCVMPNSSWL